MSTRIPSAGRPGATPPPEVVTGAAARTAPDAPADTAAADGIEIGAGAPVFVPVVATSSDDGGARYADRGGLCAGLAAEAAVGLRALPREDDAAFGAAIAQVFADLDAVVPVRP